MYKETKNREIMMTTGETIILLSFIPLLFVAEYILTLIQNL